MRSRGVFWFLPRPFCDGLGRRCDHSGDGDRKRFLDNLERLSGRAVTGISWPNRRSVRLSPHFAPIRRTCQVLFLVFKNVNSESPLRGLSQSVQKQKELSVVDAYLDHCADEAGRPLLLGNARDQLRIQRMEPSLDRRICRSR